VLQEVCHPFHRLSAILSERLKLPLFKAKNEEFPVKGALLLVVLVLELLKVAVSEVMAVVD
jgi:hypothetical protein